MDPKYKGHISMWDDGPGAVTVSSYIHGYDETDDHRPSSWPRSRRSGSPSSDLNLLLLGGRARAVPHGSRRRLGRLRLAGRIRQLLGQGVPVAYANPKEGRNSWVGVYGIRKGTENYDLALKFLDAKLAEATGNNVVNLFYYGHRNQDVMTGITDETLEGSLLDRRPYDPRRRPTSRPT